ncbi:MAG TPA: serine hydrolase domain-containing protein [Phycisphaerae bacterium]|nr:beta-lactamase family protein [Phycisphaerae bacterium]HOI54967.1 serine hydrolase domain-containing protein [Phycisphaerae bacterium]
MATHSCSWPVDRTDPQAVGLCPERLGRIGRLVSRYVDDGTVAGVVTLVARRGRIAHLECFGRMDVEQNVPMRDDAIFRIYSMTKPVTTVAVLMLLEEGRFLLKEPVSRYLPEFKELRVRVPGADGKDELVRPRREMTLHDLLTHLGGLSYDCIHECRDAGRSLQDFIVEISRRPLVSHPGERWHYSASNDVLGRVVEVVAGCPFDEFLQDRIFEPLGMTDTAFWVPPQAADRLAWIYTAGDDGRAVPCEDRATSPYLRRPSLPSGGGGLVSTTSDYLRFALMLLGGGALGSVRLLGRKTVELMTDDHLPAGHPPLDVNDRGYGLGVSVVRRVGETRQLCSVGEFGWGGAAATQAWIDPAEDMVSMIMMQYRPKEKFALLDEFKQTAYQAIVD